MKKINTTLQKSGWVALCCLLAAPSMAQTPLPEDALPIMVVPSERSIGAQERLLSLDVESNVSFDVTDDADWLQVQKEGTKIYLHATQNYANTPRTAKVTLTCTEEGKELTKVMALTQSADDSMNYLPEDSRYKPSGAETTGGEEGQNTISATFDSNLHTSYTAQLTDGKELVLTYNFKDVHQIDFLKYVPNAEEGKGYFGQVEVYVKLEGESDYKLYGSYDWKQTAGEKQVDFAGGLKKPESIQIKVLTSADNVASCAEMEFWVKGENSAEYAIFADDVYSELREGVTEKDIKSIVNPFIRSLAYKLYQGDYSKEYRVADYECYLVHNAMGVNYDQFAGVTGIHFPAKSKQAVVVSGIPEGMNVNLKVVAWYIGKVGNNFDGGDPYISTYALHNGVNVIDYTYDWDGLAYICYYSQDDPEQYNDIRVHFVNGEQNGYLSSDKTNEQMLDMCKNAKNFCMDLVGKKVHSVWTSEGLSKYCKSTSGGLGYRQYINTLDSLVIWEQRSLGWEKYNRVPKNKSLAYVNFTYYMFSGGLGVAFHQNTEQRTLDCARFSIWGLSHEWGHQHQMTPYFKWSGMSEVTNNIQSYYNVVMIGRDIPTYESMTDIFVNDAGYSSGTRVSVPRKNAYNARERYSYSPKMKQVCESMKDGIVAAAAADKYRAVAYADYESKFDPNYPLAPLVKLFSYFTMNGFPDFAPDWYEALRQNDNPEGSVIEKQSGLDKYEIIASAQNGNKLNRLDVLKEKYPESCWVKDSYITKDHCKYQDNAVPFILNYIRKTSRLVGYNLMPFFDQWGYLRQVALEVNDYGTKYYVMTPDMYNEFKADMDALVESGELKELTDDMLNAISQTKGWDHPAVPIEE